MMMSKRMRVLVLCLVALASGLVSQVAFGGAEPQAADDDFIYIDSSACPDVLAVFDKHGLPAPQTFGAPNGDGGGQCPNPEEIEASIESSIQSTSGTIEMEKALKAGAIEEDQDPRTYPRDLQEAIGLEQKLTPEANAALDEHYGTP